MLHFNLDIKVDNTSDIWGHYIFKFPICSSIYANDGILPYSTTIASVTVRSFVGMVDENTDLSAATEITTLIEATPVIQNDNEIALYFQHPGASYKNKKVGLIFELTLSEGQKKSFYGYYVEIGWSS